MKSSGGTGVGVRRKLFPTADFFRATFSEPNKVAIYPAIFIGVVGFFFIDSWLEVENS